MRRGTAALVLASGLLAATVTAMPCGDAYAQSVVDGGNEAPMVAALRANGARILALGEQGGLDGHFVELADGDAYGLYLTPDGHAVAGLLYGPDGTLLTGRQIAAARIGSGGGVETTAVPPVWEAASIGEVSTTGRSHGGEATPGAPVQLAHAYADDPAVPGVETLFERSVSAFGFTLGHTPSGGHTGLAVAFADPGCRWSRAAVARLAHLALDGRLRLRIDPGRRPGRRLRARGRRDRLRRRSRHGLVRGNSRTRRTGRRAQDRTQQRPVRRVGRPRRAADRVAWNGRPRRAPGRRHRRYRCLAGGAPP